MRCLSFFIVTVNTLPYFLKVWGFGLKTVPFLPNVIGSFIIKILSLCKIVNYLFKHFIYTQYFVEQLLNIK